MDTNVYEYSPKDFVDCHNCDSWSNSDAELSKSKFDNLLCSAWDEAQQNGAFWYNLDEVRRKIIPGKHKIIAQFNEKRFAQRRKPDEMTEVEMPFDPNRFNFTKIKTSEVLFGMKRENKEEVKDQIIINVSPIEYGHVLIIPRYRDSLPQVLDAYAVQLAAEVCLLTAHQGFSISFNSLCAMASVNQLHLHALYSYHPFPVNSAEVKQYQDDLYTLKGYMVNGFVLQLWNEEDLIPFSQAVEDITKHLSHNNIPQNVIISRRNLLDHQNDADTKTYVTVYIIPKLIYPGSTDDPFFCASLELSGFLPLRNPNDYEEITEEKTIEILNKLTYANDEFDVLTDKLCMALPKYQKLS